MCSGFVQVKAWLWPVCTATGAGDVHVQWVRSSQGLTVACTHGYRCWRCSCAVGSFKSRLDCGLYAWLQVLEMFMCRGFVQVKAWLWPVCMVTCAGYVHVQWVRSSQGLTVTCMHGYRCWRCSCAVGSFKSRLDCDLYAWLQVLGMFMCSGFVQVKTWLWPVCMVTGAGYVHVQWVRSSQGLTVTCMHGYRCWRCSGWSLHSTRWSKEPLKRMRTRTDALTLSQVSKTISLIVRSAKYARTGNAV